MPRPQQLPVVSFASLGGTITMTPNVDGGITSTLKAADLVASAPGLGDFVAVRAVTLAGQPSASLSEADILRVVDWARAEVGQGAVGAVVIQGTDTLEETAYFLNLVVKSHKPVVLVGAMRPGTALSADGPLNVYNAVVVAASKQAAGLGTLMVMNDEIHSARDVTKTNSLKVETFRSLYGPLGTVVESQLRFYRAPIRPHTLQSEFDIDKIQSLPEVNVVYTHGNMSRVPYDAFVAAGTKAIIHMGFGNGSVPDYLDSALREIRAKGVFIVRTTRTGSGAIVRNGETNDDKNDYIVVDDQNPAKARILMALALMKTNSTAELQKIFWKY